MESLADIDQPIARVSAGRPMPAEATNAVRFPQENSASCAECLSKGEGPQFKDKCLS